MGGTHHTPTLMLTSVQCTCSNEVTLKMDFSVNYCGLKMKLLSALAVDYYISFFRLVLLVTIRGAALYIIHSIVEMLLLFYCTVCDR